MLARRPAAANPIAVDPNDAIDRNEFADESSSSVASSGIRLSYAGSKNCLTPALSRMSAYRPTTAIDSMPMTNAMSVDEDRLDQARPDEDPLAVVPVDEDAGEQTDDQAGYGGRHQRQAHGEGRTGLAIDPDAGRQIRQ